MPSPLSIYVLCPSERFAQAISPYLRETSADEAETERYISKQFKTVDELLLHLRQVGHADCLVLQAVPELRQLFEQLQQQIVFFPTVVVEFSSERVEELVATDSALLAYHPAVITLPARQINEIWLAIDQAISKFIQFKPNGNLPLITTIPEPAVDHQLVSQQIRLAEKLKERLNYLGVYYKRNSKNFIRHMALPQREELLRQLRADYREIILSYFLNEPDLNSKIDNFANVAFFADVPIAQIVEIHMDLMDEFSKQLKLEGRSDEILLDYRLTLIDTLAHLCEMYRRSIPRES